MAESLTLGLFDRDESLAGFCRMITDRSTFAWLRDVYVDRTHRGTGAGTFMVSCAVRHPDVATVKRQVLATAADMACTTSSAFAIFPRRSRQSVAAEPHK